MRFNETDAINLKSTHFENESDLFEPLAYRFTKQPELQLLKIDSVHIELFKFAFLVSPTSMTR